MSLKEKYITIKSIEDLIRCISLASLLEVSGHPKPGNVHRTRNFKETRYEHFLAGITAITPSFKELCERAQNEFRINNNDYSYVKLGNFFKKAAEKMMAWQKGGNVLLGHILILAPLAAAAAICLKKQEISFSEFSNTLNKVINDATVEDTINLYDAIRTSNPGGLGKIDKYDLNDEHSLQEIQSDNVTLKKIFEISAEYDLIGLEYTTGFHMVLTEGLPYFFLVFKKTNDINSATVNTFLKILSGHPDSLIIRKSGLESAIMVSEKAAEIIKSGGINTKKGLRLTQKLDKMLHEKEGQLNPGTTADLTAGIILCALLFGLIF